MTTLSDIVGHAQSLRVLRRSLAQGRLHHSLLFHGPEAVGKRTTAIALAAALNCASAGGSEGRDDACGRCPACLKVDRGIHPDVATVTLEKTVIPIDAIRALRREAASMPFEGARRVFIVDPADRMSDDAQNALLKTLEEPAASSCIILVTSRPMHLLPTTRSRCQGLAFGTLPVRELAGRLEAVRGLPPADAWRAARLAGGRLGAAMQIDLARHDAEREELISLLAGLAATWSPEKAFEAIERFGSETEEIGGQLRMLSGLLRDIMLVSQGAPEEALLHADRAADLAALATRLARAPGALPLMLDRVRLAQSDLERNVNRKLLLETLLFDLAGGTSAT